MIVIRSWRIRGPAWLLLALAGCQPPPPPQPCALAFATDLPLSFVHGQVLTPAILDGRPARMLLDTGAQFTVVTKATADRMSVDMVAAPGQMSGIGGSRGVYIFSAESFQIGRLAGKNLPLMVSDMVVSSGGFAVDGLLGTDFLSSYDVDLDFPQATAKLFKPTGTCRTAQVYLDGSYYEAPLVLSERPLDFRPYVQVQVGGRTLLAGVDSGAAHTLIFRNAARRIGLRFEGLSMEPHFLAHGVGPDTQVVVRHVMAPITIGDITVSNLPVAIIDEASPDDTDMLLGLDFLAHVHVWLSFSTHTMIMQYPPKPSPTVPK